MSEDIETRTYHERLGVITMIYPFYFPAIVPLQCIPTGIITGNTMILKPSERDPSASMILAELIEKEGLFPSIINIIHGTYNAVKFILDEFAIKAICFVGRNKAGEYIYTRGSKNSKGV